MADAAIDIPILIIGGGLAGLSAAYHLRPTRSLVVEREGEVGGTARSFSIGGFTFDVTGHLLHLHDPYTQRLVRELLGGDFYECRRNAWIFSNGTYTPYPFQAATQGLPDAVIDDCVLGFFDTYVKRKGVAPRTDRGTFRTWCLETFGNGIARHFMLPYNRKLYQVPADRMNAEWCGAFVPMPKLEDVIRGALEKQDAAFGYNTTFLYPKKGGIQALAQSLARRVGEVRLKTTVKRIDWKRRLATLSDGTVVRYRRLINTAPLATLVDLLGRPPAAVSTARRQLKFASILCLNIGVARAHISRASWIYFPEERFPFYRVGFPMNFTPHVVPKGCSSMYVEVPMDAASGRSEKQILAGVRRGLIEAGILTRADRLPVVQFLPIRYAYVIYDENRRPALERIGRFLRANGMDSIGRYGAWKYSFMEEAILDGKRAAEAIRRPS